MPGDTATLQENALALARLAVEMQRLCATLTAPDGSPVVMRIGLHCGPVVGGVVGGNMIRYHLFGSTMDAVSQVRGCVCGGVEAASVRAYRQLPPQTHPKKEGGGGGKADCRGRVMPAFGEGHIRLVSACTYVLSLLPPV